MTTIVFCNLDGTHRREPVTLDGVRRNLRQICRDFGDASRPWMVAISRKPHLLKFRNRVDDFARFIARPTIDRYRLEKDWSKTRVGPTDVPASQMVITRSSLAARTSSYGDPSG